MTMASRNREPVLQHYTLTDQHGDTVEVDGFPLGAATSEVGRHNGHEEEFAPRRVRCSACRWFEALILDTSEDHDHDYLVYTCGRSIVPGESDIHTLVWTNSPQEILAVLSIHSHGGQVRLTGPSDRAMAQASDLDQDIRDVYENRVRL